MSYYLVRARPIREKMDELKRLLASGNIRAMKPFGQALQMGLDGARWQEHGAVIWEEEDYCVPPLAQERAAVLDSFFTEVEVERVENGMGWQRIETLPKVWS